VSVSHLFREPRLGLLAADAQHESHAVSFHKRRYDLWLACEGIRPAQHDEELSAIQMEIPSNEAVLALDDVGDERQPEDRLEHVQKDHQKDLQRRSLTSHCKQGYLLSENRAFQEVHVPGTTDGSMPVGSAETICAFF
jgi:hypothetical protein